MYKTARNTVKHYRKYSNYYEYVDNVVKKCQHNYLVLDSKVFRAYRFERQSNPNAVLKPGVHVKITPAKCKSYSCPICGRKKVLDLVDRLRGVDFKKYRFFTLTLVNKYNYDDTERNLKRVSSCFNKLNLKLRKRPEFKGLEYFRITEIGSNGNVHIHGIWNKYIPQVLLSSMWKQITKDSYRTKVERIKRPKDAINYLYKYLTKDVAKSDMHDNPKLFQMDLTNSAALFYELNKRRFSASRNFFPVKKKKETEFLPYWYEAISNKDVEYTITDLVRTYDLKLNNFDFKYYFGSDVFLDELFKPARPPD